MSQLVTKAAVSIEVIPTVSANSAYTAEDQVGGIQTLTGACSGFGSASDLISITVTDKAKQSAALSIFFFDELPTVVSVDNGAIDISDAEMADKCIGVVSLAAANYVALANSSVISSASINLKLKSKTKTLSGSAAGDLFAVVKTTGTPTYTSTSDLCFKYSLIKD